MTYQKNAPRTSGSRISFSRTQEDKPAPDHVSAVPVMDDEIDLGQLFKTLWRGKWFIILVAILAVLAGGYYAYRVAVPVYTASSVVVLDGREDQIVSLDSVVSGLAGDQASLNTEIEVLKSRELIGKLVDRLDLTRDPEFNPKLQPETSYSLAALKAAVGELVLGAKDPEPAPTPEDVRTTAINRVLAVLTASNVRQSYVFRITAVTTDPQKSARIVNTLADLYVLDQLETKFKATEQATNWLTARVTDLQVELEAAETAAKEFNARTDLVGIEALDGLNRRVKETRARLEDATRARALAQERLSALVAAQAGGDMAAMAAAAQDRTLERVLALVNGGNADQAETFRTRFAQVLARARQEVVRADNQVGALSTALNELETKITQQSEDLVQLQQLQREAEAARLIYEYFLGRLKETSVQQGIQQADSRVLSYAPVPDLPSAPRKSMILALAAILGLFLGAGIILLREMLQSSFRTADDLERTTGYTVLGQIPIIKGGARRKTIEYLASKPASAAAEAVRNLRTSVLLSNVDVPPQIIMTTSSVPGEGKTTQAISLAQNFAGLGKKVLLLEGDIRRRVFGQYFDIKGDHGLLSVLAGEVRAQDVIVHSDLINADVLVAHKSTRNAADVFSSESYTRLLAELRNIYDVIIIDTPPVLVVPDARIIGQSVDAILFSVKWDVTPKTQVLEALRFLETVNVRVTGLVLSQIDPKGMRRYGYGDQYGAYSKYGKRYYDA